MEKLLFLFSEQAFAIGAGQRAGHSLENFRKITLVFKTNHQRNIRLAAGRDCAADLWLC